MHVTLKKQNNHSRNKIFDYDNSSSLDNDVITSSSPVPVDDNYIFTSLTSCLDNDIVNSAPPIPVDEIKLLPQLRLIWNLVEVSFTVIYCHE